MRVLGISGGLLLGTSLLLSGCMGMAYQEPDQPRTIYSATDATALVYSDPDAAAPVHDNPWRWLGFLLHPLGLVVDYGINRPLYSLSSASPGLFGYTTEDAQTESQRGGVAMP